MTDEPHLHKPTRLEALRDALGQGAGRQVHRLVNSMHPAEIASLLESLPPAQREVVWDLVDPELEGDVLVELNEEVRADLIQDMEAEDLVADLKWAGNHFAPWVWRRLRGVSSGDGRVPKQPELREVRA